MAASLSYQKLFFIFLIAFRASAIKCAYLLFMNVINRFFASLANDNTHSQHPLS